MESKKQQVYKITNKINGKVYVGITNRGVKTRWYKHCSDSIRGSEFPLHNALRKYGIDNFSIDILEEVKTSEELKEREKYWILTLQSKTSHNGYNLTDGGDGTFGRPTSEETKEKIRQKALGRKPSSSVKQKMIDASSQKKEISQFTLDGVYIKTYASLREAERETGIPTSSLSACARGKYKYSKGFKWAYSNTIPKEEKKVSDPAKSPKPIREKKPMAESIRKQISETNKLRWTPERKIKQSIENIKNRPILQYTLDGEFVQEFRNVSEAVKAVGATTHTNIAKCARGIRKKACGFVWKYKDNITNISSGNNGNYS